MSAAPESWDKSGWDPSEAARILDAFETQLARTQLRDSGFLLGPGYRLFRQAVNAYQAKAVALAALGLRATVENAGYLVLTNRRHGPGGWILRPLGKPDEQRLFTPDEWNAGRTLEWIIEELGRIGVLDDGLKAAALRVRDHGRAIAHFAHRKDRATYREMNRGHSAPYILRSEEGTAGEVLDDIRSTSRILLRLTEFDADEARSPKHRVGP